MDPYQKRKKLLVLLGVSAVAVVMLLLIAGIGGSKQLQLATYQSELFSVSHPSTYNVVRSAGSAVEFSNPDKESGGVIRIQKYAQTSEKISLGSLKDSLGSNVNITEKTFNQTRVLETKPSSSSGTYYLEHQGAIWRVEFDFGDDSGLASAVNQILDSLTFKDLGL